MDQILSDGKNRQGASGRCVVTGDKYQEPGTSGVSDWTTSILVVNGLPSVINVITLLFAGKLGIPVLLFPTPYQAPITQTSFTLSPLVLSQPLIPCHSKS